MLIHNQHQLVCCLLYHMKKHGKRRYNWSALSTNSNYLAQTWLSIPVIDWPSYNRSLFRRGEILFSYCFLDTWDAKLEKMNKSKKGKSFILPGSFILVISYIRTSFHLLYRRAGGIVKVTEREIIKGQGIRKQNTIDLN